MEAVGRGASELDTVYTEVLWGGWGAAEMTHAGLCQPAKLPAFLGHWEGMLNLFFKGEKNTTRTHFPYCQGQEVPSRTCCARLAC